MERKALLAVVLMIGVIMLSNILFPPIKQTPQVGQTDSIVAPAPGLQGDVGRDDSAERAFGGGLEEAPVPRPPPPAVPLGVAPPPADTITVKTDLYTLSFSTIGAVLVSAQLSEYESYVENGNDSDRVELIREGESMLGYAIAVGRDTVQLLNSVFEVSANELDLSGGRDEGMLEFTHRFPGSEVRFVLTYRFRSGSYLIETEGRLEGLPERGYSVLTSLGNGLRTNEKNSKEDHRQLAYVVSGRGGRVRATNLDKIDPGELRTADGGPFSWVAMKSKYFLVALVAGAEEMDFGGLIASGRSEEQSTQVVASMPVPAGSQGFGFRIYLGPQDYNRLEAVGQGLQNANPYGYKWLQPVMRPLVRIVMLVLNWLHNTLSLQYGWVLIVFGVMMRVVLFPLYQKSMRSQMEQMLIQPLMKEIQAKYKEDPQRLQKEMMKLYKEHHVNPLSGCLPMLLPMPILFTLFFVFRGTIQFRGVPFLWLPDLSLKDPLYIIPLTMGLSMFLLQRIGQRGMEMNSQMKVMAWAMPIFMTFIFFNFASGLNLYYTTSNLASLPQQMYLARERRAARSKMKSKSTQPDKPPGDKRRSGTRNR